MKVLIAIEGSRRLAAMKHSVFAWVVLVLAASAGPACAQSRGELLYTTHCIACHTTQVHWRDQRRATDRDSLREQVRLWQKRSSQSWSEEDIDEVTRYLDESIYRFGQAAGRAALDAGKIAQDAGRAR